MATKTSTTIPTLEPWGRGEGRGGAEEKDAMASERTIKLN